jgi:hypothetical protein
MLPERVFRWTRSYSPSTVGSFRNGFWTSSRSSTDCQRSYGAIAFYLDHKAEIDKYLEETAREFDASGIPMEQANPVLWDKIQRVRSKIGESRA